jgi:hypothetical protein
VSRRGSNGDVATATQTLLDVIREPQSPPTPRPQPCLHGTGVYSARLGAVVDFTFGGACRRVEVAEGLLICPDLQVFAVCRALLVWCAYAWCTSILAHNEGTRSLAVKRCLCTSGYTHVCMHVCVCAYVRVCMGACMRVCMHACMYAYMYACIHVCMITHHACMYAYMHSCIHVCMCTHHACIHVCMCTHHACMYACMHAYMYACVHIMLACMHVCMYACMHVCMYACMHACMYACIHTCTHAHT